MRRLPESLLVITPSIPAELRESDQWAAWRWEKRNGKYTKPPLNPATGGYARNNDPDTWGSFEAALWRMHKDRLPGVGFMFHPEDGLAGVDLDDCRDPNTGEIEPWAAEIICELDSYTEISPSGTGLKVFLRGELPPGRRRKGHIEMYDRGRFFTTTGYCLESTAASIKDRQEQLTRLHRRVFGSEKSWHVGKPSGRGGTARSVTDSELIARAMRAANGERFQRRWSGDTSAYATANNDGHSEADLALCSLLAFWCGPDEVRIDRLFRQSGLCREKWTSRADYRSLTLSVALDRDEFWGGDRARITVYARREGVVRHG